MKTTASHTVGNAYSVRPRPIGFYTTGRLFLEEYYALTVLARGGIGTNHLDGNTRLCTATAGEALKESFGSDGQPGSYADVDHADVIALYGHNVAETRTVLWARMLDRLRGPNPPALVCVDPRTTQVARAAAGHDLRETSRTRWHSVTVHRGASGRHRAAVRRRDIPCGAAGL